MIRLLGTGGEGEVYLVKHLLTEQLRAAKLLGTGIHGEHLHELDMMKRLNHPSLPQIIDLLEEKHGIWLIMEYIKGRPLPAKSWKTVQAEQFYSIAGQLAEVLVYLHTRDTPILHLDIKPSNILICPNGRVVLIDFGTAIECREKGGQNHPFGTKGFAAPEQQQEYETADIRSDIYGFGAVMYYYFFGIPPDQEKEKINAGGRNALWKKSAQKMIYRCLKVSKEERFPDSLCLQREIKRQERTFLRRRKGKKCLEACLLLGLVVVFLLNCWSVEENIVQKEQKNQYEMLLRDSEKLGFEQACQCYEAALRIKPSDFQWIFHLIDRISEDDLFEASEEVWWNRLIFTTVTEDGKTIKELLEEQKETYGLLAYKAGMLYWYYYQETGGKYAAYKWFCEALDYAEEETASWYDFVRIHAKIGEYYGKIGKAETETENKRFVQQYWLDLTEIWKMDDLESEPVFVRLQVAHELLSCLLMHGSKLAEAGIKEQELYELTASIQTFFIEETEQSVCEAGLLQCEEAENAIERNFHHF